MVYVSCIAVDEAEHAEEIMDGCEKQQDKVQEDQQNALSHKSEQHLPESLLPVTPSFEICRWCSSELVALIFCYFGNFY